MSENNTKMSISLPTFNGKDSEFAVFWPRFRAYATVKKFSKALNESTCGLPDDLNSANLSEDTKKLIEVNNLAVASFMMSFTTAGLMEHIEASKTEMYKEGIAHVIVNEMMKKYHPRDRIAGVEAEKELMKLKMKSKSDPDKYFNKLAVLKNKYRSNANTFNEEKMIAATLAKAPGHYSAVLTQVLREKGENLKLQDMQSALKEQWRIRNNLVNGTDSKDDSESNSDGKGTESALFMANIKCYNCGQTGHKANQCPKKKSNNRGGGGRRKFNGTCNNCGKRGHKEADCWLLEKNAHKCPANWKTKSNNDEAGGSAVELCMMITDQPGSMNDEEYEEVNTDDEYEIINQEFCMMCCNEDSDEDNTNINTNTPSAATMSRKEETNPIEANVNKELNVKDKEENKTKIVKEENENKKKLADMGVERIDHATATAFVMESFGRDAYEKYMKDVKNNNTTARPTFGVDEEIRAMNLALWGDDEETQAYVNETFDVPTDYFNKLKVEESNEDDENKDNDNDNDSCASMPDLIKRNRFDDDSSDDESSDDESDDDDSDDEDIQDDTNNEVNEDDFAGSSIPKTLEELQGSDYWIGDTGATTHLTSNNKGIINGRKVTKGSENVVMGNGNACATSIVGDLIATMCNKNGKVLMPIKLGDVTCSNDVKFNLFSITAMLKKGWTMQGTKESITLKQGKKRICFDAVIDTPKGRLFTMLIKRDRNLKELMYVNGDIGGICPVPILL
jgi:hypothetical protein